MPLQYFLMPPSLHATYYIRSSKSIVWDSEIKGMLKLELLAEQLKFATARYLLANFEAIKL